MNLYHPFPLFPLQCYSLSGCSPVVHERASATARPGSTRVVAATREAPSWRCERALKKPGLAKDGTWQGFVLVKRVEILGGGETEESRRGRCAVFGRKINSREVE
ncbi:unnamed protein product [Nezara viridula]|uniref:Uncharacterized protein n=1 Tax=Nezara viridula TaxID=85310 RepID=A0A9P0HGG7_NEZVI|nr:unnamed protein product [Nezara viridula]